MESDGNKIAIINTVISAIKNGSNSFVNASIETSDTVHATYMQSPTGGVINPMTKDSINTIPKWMGSTPNPVTIGNRKGENRIRRARVSTKQPRTMKLQLIKKSTNVGLDVIFLRVLPNGTSNCSIAKTQPITFAAANMKKIAPTLYTDVFSASKIALRDKVRYTNTPTIKTNNTATMLVSVGVKTPINIPPIMSIGMNSASEESIAVLNIPLRLNLIAILP